MDTEPVLGQRALPSGSPAIDVVVVTYNAAEVIEDCLAPLVGDPRLRVVVVDNNSTDSTLDILGRINVLVVASATNLGFGAASNLGAAKGGGEQILFLNPDTRTDPEAIVTAAAHAKYRAAGVLGCRLVTLDGELDHAARRNIVRPWAAARFLLTRSPRSAYVAPVKSEFSEMQVDAVNGAFMLLDRTTFVEVGGFDEDYWMYMEDIDLCLRVKSSGKSVIYWPGVTVIHIKSAITGRSRTPRLNYHFYKSMAVFYRKHQAGDDKAPLRVLTRVGIWAFCSFAIVRDSLRRRRGTGVPYTVGR